jgi:hypothetical protein
MEPTIFQFAGGVIVGSFTIVLFFLRIARKLERRSREIVEDKIKIIDERLVTFIYTTSLRITQTIFRKIYEELNQKGIKLSEIFKSSKFFCELQKFIDDFLSFEDKDFEKIYQDEKFSSWLPTVYHLSDEEKNMIFNMSFLAFQLNEDVHKVFSSIVDHMTKGAVSGLLCAISLGLVDLFQLHFPASLPLLYTLILFTLGAYLYWGIYEIWELRKKEKLLNKLEKEKDINNLWKLVSEMNRNG